MHSVDTEPNAGSPLTVPSPAEIAPQSVLAQLEKISGSKGFLHSLRLCRFLRFTVERALQGQAGQLKEYLLGVEVFDRKPSYDPRIEPIVRVEARRLRAKLKRYYQTAGRDDVVRIEFRKGSYVPVFKNRNAIELTPGPVPAERHTIAVLPFVNLSDDPQNEYFSDGLTEELIRALTKVGGLQVVAWTSSAQLKGKTYDIGTIGKRLAVGAVLEGSVRKAGDRLRVTAQLIRVTDQHYLWSETYERRMQDVFAIQDEISRAIVNTLRIRLVGEPGAELVGRYTRNLEAYNSYLRGRHYFNQQTPEGLRKAIEFFERAIGEDPHYASAYAWLSDSYNLLVIWGGIPANAVMAKARAAAERAVELDDTLAEAHTSVAANRAVFDWDWRGAEGEFQRAIELQPGFASAHHGYAMLCLAPLRRFAEAIAEMERALELDPLSLFINSSAGTAFYYARQYERAVEQFGKAIDLAPNYHLGHWGLGRAYAQKGKFEPAIAAFEKARDLSGGSPLTLGGLGYAYGRSGRREEARQLLDELGLRSASSYVSPFHTAIIHLGLGRKKQALEWLEKACQEHDARLGWLQADPIHDPLRSDLRFSGLLQKVGLQ